MATEQLAINVTAWPPNGPYGKSDPEWAAVSATHLNICPVDLEASTKAQKELLCLRLPSWAIRVQFKDGPAWHLISSVTKHNNLFQATAVAPILSSPEAASNKWKLESGRRITEQKYATRVIIRSARSIYFLDLAAVDWIEAGGNYAQLHVGSKVHLVREAMNRLEAILDPYQFIRAPPGHRQRGTEGASALFLG